MNNPIENQSSRQVVVVASTKSTGLSIALTFLFGPLGMLYSTIPGAIVMFIASLIALVFTMGLGLLITWPICIIWGYRATKAHNQKLLAGAKQ
jgi:hypothetical protein